MRKTRPAPASDETFGSRDSTAQPFWRVLLLRLSAASRMIALMPELVCAECGATTEGGVGWRAEIAPDNVGGDEPEVAV